MKITRAKDSETLSVEGTTAAVALMAASIGQILKHLREHPEAEEHFTAPPFKADMTSNVELFKLGIGEKK